MGGVVAAIINAVIGAVILLAGNRVRQKSCMIGALSPNRVGC
jgi:hypothetical protein